MKRARLVALLAALAVAPAFASAQAINVDHKPVGCIVAGKYPKLPACFSPVSKLARSRVYFRPEEGPSNWYYVEMKADQPCHAGILPKPKKQLIGKRVLYYIDAFDQQFVETRGPDNPALVVANERECKKDVPVAPFVQNASVTVFPSLPAGFAGAAGLGTPAIVGIAAGGAAAVGGGFVIANNGDNGNSATTTTTQAPNNPGPNTTTTTIPTTTTTQPAAQIPFNPVFRIRPDPAVGPEPLTVTFNMCLTTGPSNLIFTYDYNGDGVIDDRGGCTRTRVYSIGGITSSAIAAPGTLPASVTYRTVMRVFQPGEPSNDASQENFVTVSSASAGTRLTSRGQPGSGESSLSAPAPVTRRLALVSHLEVEGGSGQVVINGTNAVFAGRGRSNALALGRRGENRVEAVLVQGSRGGTWRFELGSTASLEPGSLRVIAGEVALVSGDAVAFRMAGKPGERVVFTFRTRN